MGTSGGDYNLTFISIFAQIHAKTMFKAYRHMQKRKKNPLAKMHEILQKSLFIIFYIEIQQYLIRTMY